MDHNRYVHEDNILLKTSGEADIRSLCVLSCKSQVIKCRCTNTNLQAGAKRLPGSV